MWEAAIAKEPLGREGLARICRIFALERSWHDRPPADIQALRDQHMRPHVDAFFDWATEQYQALVSRRGHLRSAFGYVVRQRAALTRFFDDGRLRLDKNHSEHELRRVTARRRAWIFVGSDDHAQATGNLLTLAASARLPRPRS